MKSWLDAVKQCYGIKDGAVSDKSVESLSFGIFDTAAKNITLLPAGNDCLLYDWDTEGENYLLAAGRGEKAAVDELQDKLETVFDNLLGAGGNAELYAARYVVIDDMQGLEVCGETVLDGVTTVFYGLYLSDNLEGYYFTGFGSAIAERVFEELTGVARHFYRKPSPATILKGKSAEKFFVSLRALAAEILPDKQIDWDILNATFEVENGKLDNLPSLIIVYAGRARTCKQSEIYDGKDLSEFASAFLGNLPSVYDISGFTVTNFKDGRYGVTYYPIGEDFPEEDGEIHEHVCGPDCRHDDEDIFPLILKNGKDSYADLDKILEKFSVYTSKSFPEDWKCGMGLITAYNEFLLLSAFSSSCGAFTRSEMKKESEEDITAKINELGEVLENHYPGWNAFAFSFNKGENGDIDFGSMRDEAFNFDVFIDAEDDDEFDEDDQYLLPIADYFAEEFAADATCVSYVTFKVAVGEDGLFVVEPATAGTSNGVVRVQSFNKYLPKISSIAEDIFEDYNDCNTISVTIFPERKFGFYLEFTEAASTANRRNFPSLLKEQELSKYESKLQPLLRDELMAIIYEVEVESSLTPGVSKLGGSPDLPKNIAYPTSEKDAPLEFVAQINLEEIAPFDKENMLPLDGILSFFFDRETKNCKVLYFKDDNVEMRSMTEKEGYESLEEFLPARLRFIPSVSLPIFGQELEKGFFDNDDEERKYLSLSEFDGKVKIFGYADAADEKNVEKEYGKPLKLLLQVPSIPECDMEWGKFGGTLYFWIEEADLKLLKFDKCFCIL